MVTKGCIGFVILEILNKKWGIRVCDVNIDAFATSQLCFGTQINDVQAVLSLQILVFTSPFVLSAIGRQYQPKSVCWLRGNTKERLLTQQRMTRNLHATK